MNETQEGGLLMTYFDVYLNQVRKHIYSVKLLPEQQKVLYEYLQYLVRDKDPKMGFAYVQQIFRVVRDFGASMKRDYHLVDLGDFEVYYSSIIDNNTVSNDTLEQYENVLKRFCGWLFERQGTLGQWKELEFKVKMIFNKDKIKERLNLDYKQAVANKKTRSVERYLKSTLLKEGQRVKLIEYRKYIESGVKKKTSVHLTHKVMMVLHQFAGFIKKDFEAVEKEDFTNYLYHLNSIKKFSPVTLDSYKHVIKQFYKYLHYKRLDPKQEYPEIVKDIELDKIQIKKSANEILTKLEVAEVIKHCTNVRDKLMVSLHYEAVTRPEELFTIRLGDIHPDDYGFQIDINRIKQKNKTNNRLTFRIIESEPYLREWLNLHPLKKDPEAYLFISLKQTGSYVLYTALDHLVKRAAKAAGINKRVYPYIFRHSRITHLKIDGYGDDEIKQITGHSDRSDILANYSHLTPQDVNNKRLKVAGKLTDKEEQKALEELQALQPKKCPRCTKINSPDARYCNCGMILDLRVAMEEQMKSEKVDNILSNWIKDPSKAQILSVLNSLDSDKAKLLADLMTKMKVF